MNSMGKSNQKGRFYKPRTVVEYVAAEVQIKYNTCNDK